MRSNQAMKRLAALAVAGALAAPNAVLAGPWDKPFSSGGALSIGKPFKKGGALSVDKPLDKGGSLSIDKPLDKGGELSINKPFDKGGGLSIDKIYVPKGLRIGKVQTWQEVLFPICWGRPQECREAVGIGPSTSLPPQDPAPYFISARFNCVDRDTGKNGGDCTINVWSKVSCQDALDTLRRKMTQGQPCAECSEVRDPNCVWDGRPPEHIQGSGLCVGW